MENCNYAPHANFSAGYGCGKEDAIKEVFNFLKKNYLIKSKEPLRWVSWDKVKNDYLKSISNYESRN